MSETNRPAAPLIGLIFAIPATSTLVDHGPQVTAAGAGAGCSRERDGEGGRHRPEHRAQPPVAGHRGIAETGPHHRTGRQPNDIAARPRPRRSATSPGSLCPTSCSAPNTGPVGHRGYPGPGRPDRSADQSAHTAAHAKAAGEIATGWASHRHPRSRNHKPWLRSRGPAAIADGCLIAARAAAVTSSSRPSSSFRLLHRDSTARGLSATPAFAADYLVVAWASARAWAGPRRR